MLFFSDRIADLADFTSRQSRLEAFASGPVRRAMITMEISAARAILASHPGLPRISICQEAPATGVRLEVPGRRHCSADSNRRGRQIRDTRLMLGAMQAGSLRSVTGSSNRTLANLSP